MNYRLLLTEMLADYVERRDTEENISKVEVYTEIIGDLLLSLNIEPNMQNQIDQVNNIIK